MWSRTSLRVMRPPAPVPSTSDGSMSYSDISRRTTGDRTRPSPFVSARSAFSASGSGSGSGSGFSSAAGASGSGSSSGSSSASGSGSSAFSSAFSSASSSAGSSSASASAGAAPSPASSAESPITAIGVPTSTVSPSSTRISTRYPPSGDGTSESTLSVDTSKSRSSALTSSPTCLIHRVIVPSVTVSPSCGMVISVRAKVPPGRVSRAVRGRSATSGSRRTARSGSGGDG